MNIEFNSSGGTSIVTYAINCDGTVGFTSSDESWLHISFGDGNLTISVDEYEGQNDRSGTITPSVNGTDCPNKVINVTQKKGSQPDCEVSAVTYDFGYREINVGPCKTSVEFEIPYTATTSYTDSEQCEDEINTGFSSVTVTFDSVNCEEEPNIITTDYYKVTQQAGPCDTCGCTEWEYNVTPSKTRLNFGACADNETITLATKKRCTNPAEQDFKDFTPSRTVWYLSEEVEGITIASTSLTSANIAVSEKCETDAKNVVVNYEVYDGNSSAGSGTINIVQEEGKCGSCECTSYDYKIFLNDEILLQEQSLSLPACSGTSELTVSGKRTCTNSAGAEESFTPNVTWEISGNSGITLSDTNGTRVIVYSTDNCDETDRKALINVTVKDNNTTVSSATINITQVTGQCQSCECATETTIVSSNTINEYTHFGIDYTGDTEFNCSGGSITVQPFRKYDEYKEVSSITKDCHGTIIDENVERVYISRGNVENYGSSSSATFNSVDCSTIGSDFTSSVTFSVTYGGETEQVTATQTCEYCEFVRIKPYITLEQYARPQEGDKNYKYTLHFKTADNDKPVDTDLYFMTNSNDSFNVLAASGNCQLYTGITCENYSVSKSSENTWKINHISTYENKDLVTTAGKALPGCCTYKYEPNNMSIHFGQSATSNTAYGVYSKPTVGSENSIRIGNKLYWLDISQQTEYNTPSDNHNFSFIETVDTGSIIRKASQVTFESENGNTMVSVYEDGVVLVDETYNELATVNEAFDNITHFANKVYPNKSYERIQSCFFNYEDLEGHCVNDIVIKNGELVRENEQILPSQP